MNASMPARTSDSPLVSVVIATFNMGRFLPQAVQSVLLQTYRRLELHVVDDGSTDDTKERIRPFLEDSRLVYHYQENRGQARAKNHGIEQATGDFIAFLDADDVWFPDKLEKQLLLFDGRPNLGVVYTSFVGINEAGTPFPPSYIPTPRRGAISRYLLIENCINFCTTVVRRQCFETLGRFDESLPMGIDYDLWLRFSAVYEIDFVPEPKLYYRVWPGQMSRNTGLRYECGIRIMERFLRDHPGLIPPTIIAEAWAHTFTGRAYYHAYATHDRLLALKDYGRALRYSPTHLPAWKGIVKLLLP